MITVSELCAKAERKYNDFLKWKIADFFDTDEEKNFFFPLEIKADKGKASDNPLVREKELKPLIQNSKDKCGKGYKLIFEEVKTRSNGIQSALNKIIFEKEDDFLYTIKKDKETKLLENALKIIAAYEPKIADSDFLSEWANHNLSELTEDHSSENDFWENICLCVQWLNENQDSGLYIREIPLPVHTKFIEQNAALIKSLTRKSKDETDFITAFGLKGKNDFVRFRSLSNNVQLTFSKTKLTECNMTMEDFCHLDDEFLRQIKNVFIVENEMVYLTMPEVPDSICVWGQGYKVNVLGFVEWFKKKNLFYFGDLDEHGFDILSTYRTYYPNVKSFCMTEKVLTDYDQFRVEVNTRMQGRLPGLRIPENLTEEEMKAFMNLRNSKRNRLEQERISVRYIGLKKINGLECP